MSTDSRFELLFKEALTLQQSNQFELAIHRYLELLAIKPQHFDALQLLATCYAHINRYDLAIATFSDALAINKKNPKVFNNYGFVLAKVGDTANALKMYEKALKLDTTYLDALNNLANLFQQMGSFEKAVDLYTRINKIDKNYVQSYFNKGVALQKLNRLPQALSSYEETLKRIPNHVDALLNKAIICKEMGLYEDSKAIYKALLNIPNTSYTFDLYNNYGNLLQAMGSYSEAIDQFDLAIMANPNQAITYSNRGNALQRINRFEESLQSYAIAITLLNTNPDFFNNRGNVHQKSGDPQSSLHDYDYAVSLDPSHVQAYYNKANLYKELGEVELARENYKYCLYLEPRYADAHNNLGNVYKDLNNFSSALISYDDALRFNPSHIDAHVNKGVVLQKTLDLSGALKYFDLALSLDSNNSKALVNKAMVLLLEGKLSEAWPIYENRLHDKEFNPLPLITQKPFLTDLNSNIRVLLWSEQGVGDEVMFASMFTNLQRRVRSLIIKVDPRLISLFERSFPGIIFYKKEDEVIESLYDAHLPMGSLCNVLQMDVSDVRGLKPAYIFVDRLQSEATAQSLQKAFDPLKTAPSSGIKKPLFCGISWKSINPKSGLDRSVELDLLLSELKTSEIFFVNLQYPTQDFDDNKAQILNQTGSLITTDINIFEDIDGFVNLIDACDIVLTIDNSTAHFSAALGKPTLVLLPYCPDWRWMLETEKSYWYPSVTLFRQKFWGDWSEPLRAVKTALHAFKGLQ
jgi:tetratricopeptide (TPR) repeat protein